MSNGVYETVPTRRRRYSLLMALTMFLVFFNWFGIANVTWEAILMTCWWQLMWRLTYEEKSSLGSSILRL